MHARNTDDIVIHRCSSSERMRDSENGNAKSSTLPNNQTCNIRDARKQQCGLVLLEQVQQIAETAEVHVDYIYNAYE